MQLQGKNSLRNRFLLGHLSITLLIVIVGGFTSLLFNQIQWVSDVRNHINKLEVLTLSLIKTDNDFFDYEATNEEYFQHRRSAFLSTRNSLMISIKERIEKLRTSLHSKNHPIDGRLDYIDSLYSQYNLKFEKLEKLLYIRGYKDFGMEGSMRNHAHALELPSAGISSSEILMLRRSEKDFLLRHDISYVQQFNTLIGRLIVKLKKNRVANSGSLYHTERYRDEFNARANMEKEIGLTSHSGLRWDLNQLTAQLNNRFAQLSKYADEVYNEILRSVVLIYLAAIAAAVVISWISSLWISKKLSAPIIKLTKWVNSTGPHKDKHDVDVPSDKNEIDLLTQSFINLVKRTRNQMSEIDKKNQELVKLNHELDNFLYSTAHDLRSPLSSLTGLVRLMRIENQQSHLGLYLDMMETNIVRQEDFISQIVNYAKNSKLEILPEELNLKPMILNIFQNHEFIEGASGIQKYVSVRQDIPFYSDKNRIAIILNNLISNAIRYADKSKGGERFIEIRIEVSSEFSIISFSDNGIGIHEEFLDKIFNMFYRASTSSKGSGLGLFILKEAVQKLGGSVSVESKINEGTQFFLQIPNLYQNNAAIPAPQEAEASVEDFT